MERSMKNPTLTVFQSLGLGLVVLMNDLAWGARVSAQTAANDSSALQVTFLINEGFLVQGAGKSVVFDAFVRDEYYGYGSLPEDTYQRMIGGQEPFADVTLALTSHVHLDHFQVEPAVRFLQTHSECLLVSGEEVVLAIRAAKSEPAVSNQAQILWPEPDKTQTIEHNDIRIEGFRLRHSGARNNEVQNLGLIVHLGDFSILHVGDADASDENFEPFNLPDKKIDVAILPDWMFVKRDMVDRQIGAAHYIAAHIPFAELSKTKRELAESNPDVIVLEKPLEQWRLSE
jgi:L-ascorbate metabolism protein UlaG (beta-lactamase superfamily)